jgi:hypothetical protein
MTFMPFSPKFMIFMISETPLRIPPVSKTTLHDQLAARHSFNTVNPKIFRCLLFLHPAKLIFLRPAKLKGHEKINLIEITVIQSSKLILLSDL